jgi:hypothetical protein
MRRIAAKLVPRLLTEDQKQHRLEVCMELKEVRNDPDFLFKVITGDESSQWQCPSLPRLMKARQVKSNVKSLLTCFFWH